MLLILNLSKQHYPVINRRFLEFKSYLMQTNQNSKVLFIEEENNNVEYPLNNQLQRKTDILQRINVFLNTRIE